MTADEYKAAIHTLDNLNRGDRHSTPSGDSSPSIHKISETVGQADLQWDRLLAKHRWNFIKLGIGLGTVVCAIGMLIIYASRYIHSNEAIEAVKTKILHAAGKDYSIKELIMMWNPNRNELTTGGVQFYENYSETNTIWASEKFANDTYFVSATFHGRTYSFTCNIMSKDVAAANDFARELFELPTMSFGHSN